MRKQGTAAVIALTLSTWAVADAPYGMVHVQAPDSVLQVVGHEPRYARSEHRYQIPDAILTDSHGKSFSLAQELEAEGPVMVNFIYTRCTVACPEMSAAFAEVQRQSIDDLRDLRLISITMDPGYDTPSRLRDYGKVYGAGGGWLLLTGRSAEIFPVMKAFESYSDDKSRYQPVTFLRAGPQAPWVRVEGAASAAQLIAVYRQSRSP